MLLRYLLVNVTLVILASCASEPMVDSGKAADANEGGQTTMELTSDAFDEGQAIPLQYTCDGEDMSPPLTWTEPPDGTASFAIIMDDPDAPGRTWVHWVLTDLPAATRMLDADIEPDAQRTDGSRHGQNSWGKLGYGGPCPPRGTHRYFFKLYALDTMLGLESGASKDAVLAAMDGHVLASAELMGTYSR